MSKQIDYNIEFFGLVPFKCKKCKTKLKMGHIPYKDKRITIPLLFCQKCNEILELQVFYHDDCPASKAKKIRDKFAKNYGLRIIN
ncbi:hypothetical protein J4218_03165 [Candidatus Pacearchaeota archaeon]|nr:hypothetical protein [Candidatus Pacearchaeota archaeon]